MREETPVAAPLVRCEHHVLDHHIHAFVFHESTRVAFDEFMELLEAQMKPLKPGEFLHSLLDYSKAAMPPLRYSFQRSQQLVQKYPHVDQGRTAILVNYGALIAIAQTFIMLLKRSNVVRFFDVHERDAAIAWLAAGDGEKT